MKTYPVKIETSVMFVTIGDIWDNPRDVLSIIYFCELLKHLPEEELNQLCNK